MYQKFVFPILKRMDAEMVHDRTLTALQLAQHLRVGRALLQTIAGEIPAQPVEAFGLTFPNVLGIAAGFDKDVRVTRGLGLLGFGHVEVGTLTPKPQEGNAKPRIFRLPEDGAIINRMGFPNGGVITAVSRLHTLSQQKGETIVGVSLGKQKATLLEDAPLDYMQVMRAVYKTADYLAVNISSPNTPGLRDLQGGDYLGHLLRTLRVENEVLAKRHGLKKRPLLVKIAPDLTWQELDGILDTVLNVGIDGIIATNTTLSRQGLHSPRQEETGGLSGRPLRDLSNGIIRYIVQHTEGRVPVIGVGGVQTAADVQAKLDAGAVLVQLYTGLIYTGPGLAGSILRDLSKN
ncbi:MAG: quinone-dependent dihydroorotate dehydrogenase [Ardenticatenaceae bacterium]|nr:quinone-dependent dihydroorotate dehydrogenase [Ardenticatenaceae bacterium]